MNHLNDNLNMNKKYNEWIKSLIDAARLSSDQIIEHEIVAQEIGSIDEKIKSILFDVFLDAKANLSKESKNFRSALINDVMYCFGFTDDKETRQAWLIHSCLSLISKNQHKFKKFIAIATEKNTNKEHTYHFFMVDLSKDKQEPMTFH